MASLIITIIGIIAFIFNSYIGLILTIIGLFLAKNGKKKNEKYAKKTYTVALIAVIVEAIIIAIFAIYSTIKISNIIDKTNDEINRINEKYATE